MFDEDICCNVPAKDRLPEPIIDPVKALPPRVKELAPKDSTPLPLKPFKVTPKAALAILNIPLSITPLVFEILPLPDKANVAPALIVVRPEHVLTPDSICEPPWIDRSPNPLILPL